MVCVHLDEQVLLPRVSSHKLKWEGFVELAEAERLVVLLLKMT